jgi:chemotaxis protein MotD
MAYGIGAMAITIAAKSQNGDHHFDIRLDPPELGSIAVHLSVDHTGQAVAHLTADKPETLQLLQNDSANLQSALRDAGLNLANSGLNFSLRGDQRQAGQNFQRSNSRTRTLSVGAVAAPAASSAPISSYAPGALDITI